MAKFQKGRDKTGGRQKGTPNKAHPIVREMLTEITNDKEFWKKLTLELYSLEGKEFVDAVSKMFPFIAPKMEAVAADVTTEEESSPLLDRLIKLSEKAED